MATVEQPPAVQRIPRSRSARLADQAATAALYVTHPERRLSVREPPGVETKVANLKATGSRPGFSHASAVAALSHAKSRQLELEKQAAAAFYMQDYRTDASTEQGRKASASAYRDRRSVVSFSNEQKYEISAADLSPEVRRDIDVREKALSAARGALYGNRRRADSEPLDSYGMASEGEADPYLNASRIQNAANVNARLYTASPPVSPELEEQRRKSVIQAAAISMSRDMYNITENPDTGHLGAALPAAQRGHVRARSQRSVTKPDDAALQHAIGLQEIAQKRAAEKLASMQDETLIYREYYGVDRQPTRSSMGTRKRRGSVESDTSTFDVERSKEIRHQMTSLRTKLDAVDEQRDRDRAFLLEAARRNVDATMQDMEMRLSAQTGRAPPAVRKEWEEAALARAQKDLKDIDADLAYDDKINLGLSKYMDRADVEAVARSRLQPTFDEINSRAEEERAKALEERLDEEERQRRATIERQREADTKAEEKREKAALRNELSRKEGKSWLWRRKSRRGRDYEPAAGAFATEGMATEGHQAGTEQAHVTAPQEAVETHEGDNREAVSSGAAVAGEPASMEPVARSESKLKTWFSRLSGRRSSTAADDAAVMGESNRATGEWTAGETTEPATAGGTSDDRQTPAAGVAPAAGEASTVVEGEGQRAEAATEGATQDGDHERSAPLSSHPVTANELQEMQRKSISENAYVGLGAKKGAAPGEGSSSDSVGGEWSRLKSKITKMVSKGSDEFKTNGASGYDSQSKQGGLPVEHTAADDLAGHSREDLRESAADQGLPVPPAIGKRASIGTTGRESRFSEDL